MNSESIRKKWLRSWKAMFIYHGAIGSLCLLAGLILTWQGDFKGGASDFAAIIFPYLYLLCLFTCRKCAYKNTGTKSLIFIVSACSLEMLIKLAMLINTNIQALDTLELAVFFIFDVLDLLFFAAIFSWFLITSINLRILNKNIQSAAI